jgi:hypothetical protein
MLGIHSWRYVIEIETSAVKSPMFPPEHRAGVRESNRTRDSIDTRKFLFLFIIVPLVSDFYKTYTERTNLSISPV